MFRLRHRGIGLIACRDDKGKRIPKGRDKDRGQCGHEFHCERCKVMGGREAPCQPPSYLRGYRERLGRPCPKVDLLVEDTAAWAILRAMWSGSPMIPVVVETETWWMGPEDRRSAVRAAMDAHADEAVQEEARKQTQRPTTPPKVPRKRR